MGTKELFGESSSDEEESTKQTKPRMKVTLLSGFLGAGKTTLLKRILRLNNDKPLMERLKIAVIVNDMGEINLDAQEIKTSKVIQEDAEMVELHNGCICCTLRGDLLKTVKNLASDDNMFDYLVIESTGISEPLPVAQTFIMDVDNMTDHDHQRDHQHPHDDDDDSSSEEDDDESKTEEKKDEEGDKETSKQKKRALDTPETDTTNKKLKVATDEKKSLFHYAKLDTLVTVVDALNIYDVLASVETLADKDNISGMVGNAPTSSVGTDGETKAAILASARQTSPDRIKRALEGLGLATTGDKEELIQRLVDAYDKDHSKPKTDDRSIAKLWLDQIEFANVIILSKVPAFLERENDNDKTKLRKMEKLLRKLNKDASIIPYEEKYSDIDLAKTVLNTGLFDMEKAQHSTAWITELQADDHNPETEEYGISSMTYVAKDMPFHPERLHKTIKGLKSGDGDWLSALAGNSKAAAKPAFQGVVRIKGQIWLANCNVFALDFHSAGRQVEMQPSSEPFLVEKPRRQWDEEDEENYQWMEENDWATEKWGDRRSSLVIIGVGLDPSKIRKVLDKALLTEKESEAMGGPDGWEKLKDPFYNGKLQKMCNAYYTSL